MKSDCHFWSKVTVTFLVGALPAWAGTIETEFIQRPWSKQVVRELEVGRHHVRWRHLVSRRDGLFTGARFTAPLGRQEAWDRATAYTDIGQITPGVTAVRFLEDTPARQVIQVDIKVLWKELRLTFEVERDPPEIVRFRLLHQILGEYRGALWLEPTPDGQGTVMDLATWFKPSRPVPLGLLLVVERMVLLQGAREFLESCEP